MCLGRTVKTVIIFLAETCGENYVLHRDNHLPEKEIDAGGFGPDNSELKKVVGKEVERLFGQKPGHEIEIMEKIENEEEHSKTVNIPVKVYISEKRETSETSYAWEKPQKMRDDDSFILQKVC